MASSVDSARSTNVLDSLPTRPPTPPREALHEPDNVPKSIVRRTLAFDPRLSLQTPPNADSPASPVATTSDPSSSRIRKKVEWSAHMHYMEAPQFQTTLKPNRISPPSAPSSASSKPVKGILKSKPSPHPLVSSLEKDPDGSFSSLNMIEMLDSSIKQLAGPDRDSKLDAYMMLSRALKASNNLPDRVALQDKMSLFMQFIQRDMTAKTTIGGPDASLINHSLTLLATFLHFPAIASTLTTDFGIFVMEHSIRSFEDKTIPKDVVRHLMQVVAFQNFSLKVVNLDRVGRLVAALHNIENHVKGKSIVMSRLHIYKRLIKQSRYYMVTHCDWLTDMFTDMLSTVKDIRSQAIGLGLEAGFTFRSEKQLLRKVTKIFQTTSTTDAETYIAFYIKRLQDMIKERQTCAAVPQIWSVVILFLRCPLDRWHYYGPWLTLVQSAFNMTDSFTKQEANLAWNRYVYLTVSDSKVNPKTIATLCQPLLSQLRRKHSLKQLEEALKLRRVVIGGICNLYYYAFAPGCEKCTPDLVWDAAVKPVIDQLGSMDDKAEVLEDGPTQAAMVLLSLLDVSTPRIWRHDRIMDLRPVKPDELPAIDSRWVRKNCDKVLECVGLLIRQKFCDLADKDSLICRLWQALVTSVTVASAKDIKVSDETAKFVGYALGVLSERIMAVTAEQDPAALDIKFLPSLTNYIELLIYGLGVLPFTEKRLSMTVPNTFKPVSTPWHRSDQMESPDGVVRMPLHHLFVMLSAIPTNDTDHNLASLFHSAFGPFLKNKNAKGRLDLAKELLRLIPRNTLSASGPWLFTADCAKAFLEIESPNTAACSAEQMRGPDYRDIVSLLERGLTSHPSIPATAWLSLLQAVVARVTGDLGDAGCCLVVVEPLAKVLYDLATFSDYRPSHLVFEVIIALFSLTKFPRDKQALEAARSKLWGAPNSTAKTALNQPLEALYKLGNHFMLYLYQHINDAGLTIVPRFVESLLSFLDRHWTTFGLTAAIKLQTGLGKWVQDELAILKSSHQSSLPNIISSMWDHICSNIVIQYQVQDVGISQIEALLISGLKSKHSSIARCTVLAWHAIVKHDEEPICSDNFKSIISSVSSTINSVPPAGSVEQDEFGFQESSLVQEELNGPDSPLAATGQSSDSVVDKPVSVSPRRRLTRNRQLETALSLPQNKSTKTTGTSMLPHENSQIQSEHIASSLPSQQESQHLTERQKEVRKKQRFTTGLHSDEPSTSSPATAHILSRCNRTDDANESSKQVQETPPKQNTSFKDLISFTPTPRRGEFVQMDDLNDPPSSPSIPRPCPLLSEIQSRRCTGPLENWEFSSPPGSPAENQHRCSGEAGVTSAAEVALPVKSLRSFQKHQTVTNTALEHTTETTPGEVGRKGKGVASEANIQQTKLFAGIITRARKAHEQSKPEDVTSTAVRSTSKRRSSRQMKIQIKVEKHGASHESSSYDATVMPDSKHEAQTGHAGQSTMQPAVAESAAHSTIMPPHECILVHTDLACSSSERLQETTIEDILPFIPSTPVAARGGTFSSGPRGKRKRRPEGVDVDNKKRRSSVGERTASPAPGAKLNTIPLSALRRATVREPGIETRSGLRKRQHQGSSDEKKQARSELKRQSTTSRNSADVGDTDEEVLSQLVTESYAASQQSQPQQESTAKTADDVSVFEQLTASSDLETVSKPDESMPENESKRRARSVKGSGEQTASIIESFRNGLEQLRSASLTRDKVYEVEDILMDIKRELFKAESRSRIRGRPAKLRKRTLRRC